MFKRASAKKIKHAGKDRVQYWSVKMQPGTAIMQKLKFVWGSIFCLVGTLSLLGSLKMMVIIAAAQQVATELIGGGVGTYNTIQKLTQQYEDTLTGGYILCGLAIFSMILGSFMVYASEELPRYYRT